MRSLRLRCDASGLRASKTVNGETTIYQYVGDKLYYEQRADGSKHYYFYDSYGNLAKIYRHTSLGKKVYNVVTNAQGDVVALYDFAGVLVCTYEYDAWGNLTSAKNANGAEITSQNHIAFLNPIRYRGYYYDSEIEMYYLQSRYYDPDTGRFINEDRYITTGQGVLSYNMFAYCGNNPVSRFDSGGDSWWTFACGIFGGVINATGQVLHNIGHGKEWYIDVAGAFAGGFANGAISSCSDSAAGLCVGVAVDNLVNEVITYTPIAFISDSKQKTVTYNNVVNSLVNFLLDCLEEIYAGMIFYGFSESVFPTTGLPIPETFKDSFTGEFARINIAQNGLDLMLSFFYDILENMGFSVNGTSDDGRVLIYPETYVGG